MRLCRKVFLQSQNKLIVIILREREGEKNEQGQWKIQQVSNRLYITHMNILASIFLSLVQTILSTYGSLLFQGHCVLQFLSS